MPVDFATERLAEALQSSAYDPQQLSCFSWLGVTYYLTRGAVYETLHVVAAIAPAGSAILFDYIGTDAFMPERAARRIQLMQAIVGQAGEPMQTGFDPLTLAADLQRVGLRLEEDLAPRRDRRALLPGRTDEYHAFEHVHFAQVVVV